MKSLLFSFLLFASIGMNLFAKDNIQVLWQNEDFQFNKKPKEFYFMGQDVDSTIGIKIAEVEMNVSKAGQKSNLQFAFYTLWEKANKMGSNAFFMVDSQFINEEKNYNIQVDLFYITGEEIDEVINTYPVNEIIIFGDINTKNETKGKSFSLNGEKLTIMSYSYIIHENEIGKETTISVGGFTGTKTWIKGEQGKPSKYFSLGGVSVAPSVGMGSRGGGIGLSISTGSIFSLDPNFGEFLLRVLENNESE